MGGRPTACTPRRGGRRGKRRTNPFTSNVSAWTSYIALGPAPIRVATNAFQRLPSSARLAWRAVTRGERKWVAAAAVLLPLAAMAYAAGSIAHALLKSGKDEE